MLFLTLQQYFFNFSANRNVLYNTSYSSWVPSRIPFLLSERHYSPPLASIFGDDLEFQIIRYASFNEVDQSLVNSFSFWYTTFGSVPKNLNNLIEADHGKLKRLFKPTLAFKSMLRLKDLKS